MFSYVIYLNNYYLDQDIKHYHHFRRFSLTPSNSLNFSQSIGNHFLDFYPRLVFPVLNYTSGIIHMNFLCLSTFAEHNVSGIHSCCYKYSYTYFLPFLGSMTWKYRAMFSSNSSYQFSNVTETIFILISNI